MKAKLQSWGWRLVGILSILEFPPEKSLGLKLNRSDMIQSALLGMGFRLLGVSAKHFRESLWYLWAAIQGFWHSLRRIAIVSARHRIAPELKAVFPQRLQERISVEGRDSCRSLNTQNTLSSNTEKNGGA